MESASLESLKQELNISLEDTEQWVWDVKQWAATDSNQTRGRKRRRLSELKKRLREKVLHYNTIAACEEEVDIEAACSPSEDVILPWEAQGDVVSLHLKRRLLDQVMLVRRLEEEKLIIVKEMTQHCQSLKKTLDKLDSLLHKTKEDIKNHTSSRELTEEGYKGLHCCLVQKQHILQQKLSTVTTTYTYTLDTDPSTFTLEEDLEDCEDESEQDNSSPDVSGDEL